MSSIKNSYFDNKSNTFNLTYAEIHGVDSGFAALTFVSTMTMDNAHFEGYSGAKSSFIGASG